MTNARWQRWWLLLQLCLALCWGAYWWPQSPLLALAGLPLLWAWLGLWMGMQFVWMRSVCGAAAPTWCSCWRAWGAEWRHSLAVFAWRQPFRAQTHADFLPAQARAGVVLVHGFMCNRGFWLPWLTVLRRQGVAVVAVNLEPPLGSIDDYVPCIAAAIAQVRQATGRPPLVVGHSMGGLALRAWMCATPGAEGQVQQCISIGTPHQGTWPARWSRSANGQQMAPGNPWLANLEASLTAAQRAQWLCWYSDCDNLVYPHAHATLAGADNRCLSGLGHMELAFATPVLADCLKRLAVMAENPGQK